MSRPSTPLYVETLGSGPPLVLLHGWAMHGGVFAPLVERLRAGFTLHLVDLPGHGRSRDCAIPLQLEACVEAIGEAVPAPAPWCGWSLGGLVALHAAATRPEQVPALAMLCASPCFVRSDSWRHGVSADLFRDFADGLRGSLLIAHGMLDVNVHFQDVVRLVQRLIELEKTDWELAVYPAEGHAFENPESWADEYRRVLELFEGTLR